MTSGSEITDSAIAEKSEKSEKSDRRNSGSLPAWFAKTSAYADELNRMAGSEAQLAGATGYCRSPQAHLSDP